MALELQIPSPLTKVLQKHGVEIWLKRDDLIHPKVSGNKWRKLKFYLEDFKQSGSAEILTFGGAFSNHLAATAAVGKQLGIATSALVRGHELSNNATLDYCRGQGMRLEMISRADYRTKDDPDFLAALRVLKPRAYIIPEGGKGPLGTQGCIEILNEVPLGFDYICAAAATGTTMAGMLLSDYSANYLAFAALKDQGFLKRAIANQVLALASKFSIAGGAEKKLNQHFFVQQDYHFGGYAKSSAELIEFMNNFYRKTGVKLDPVYTGKMLYGILDLAEKDYFKKGTKILALHSGGLQGIAGMNEKLRKQHKTTLEYDA